MALVLLQVTGLYAESHGIVASYMYDPRSHKHFTLVNDTDPMWWSQAEPLWITAQRYGYKTATAMWPGSDAINRTGTYFLPYSSLVSFQERLGALIQWIQGTNEVKAGGASQKVLELEWFLSDILVSSRRRV